MWQVGVAANVSQAQSQELKAIAGAVGAVSGALSGAALRLDEKKRRTRARQKTKPAAAKTKASPRRKTSGERATGDEKGRNQEDEDQKCERRSGLFNCFAANSV